MNKPFNRGEIYVADLGKTTIANTSVQKGKRPILIISNDVGNEMGTTVIVAAITSKLTKQNLPTHVAVGRKTGLYRPSIILAEQVLTLDKTVLEKYIGRLREFEMNQLNEALKISMGLKNMKKITDIRPLCHKCAAEYEDTGEYEVKYLKGRQNYEPCIKCNSPRGKNRLLIRYGKIEESEIVM